MQVDSSSPPDAVWRPDPETIAGANLTRFIHALGVDRFETLDERASRDPAWLHDALIRFLDYRFTTPYERVLDLGDGQPFAHWCVGGRTNVVLNGIDIRRGTASCDQPALVREGEDGTVSTWTFADLDRETCRLAWGLRRLGLEPGDVAGMDLPNLPHAAVAMLAVAKIGAIVLPMFSGFGADAIARRLNDGRAVGLITVDGSLRCGKPVGAKAVVDEALARCPGVQHVVVLNHLATPHDWKAGRDHGWHDLTEGAPDDVAAVPTQDMPDDDPFLLRGTSGTSGRPKGVVHSHCGFPVKTALDLSISTDLKPGDRFLWMSDMVLLVGPILVCVCVPRQGTGQGMGQDFDEGAAVRALSDAVVAGLGGAFKPARIAFVADLPRARNMKLMRRVARAAWLGEEPGEFSTLVNPESVQAIRAARPI